MGATSITENDEKKEIEDDISNVEIKEEPKMDMEKLKALKAKAAEKNGDKMAAKIVAPKQKSLRIGVVASGQGGGRLGEALFNLGYDTIALNTASQDLKFLKLPDSNKLLLESGSGIGGAARELSIGEHAAQSNSTEIMELVNDKLSDCQVYLCCFSLGGGSGSGSAETLINLLNETGKPIIALCVLPMGSEDLKMKQNSLETLSKLARLTESKVISNLIVADNFKIESILADTNMLNFYETANKSIVEIFDKFNVLSSENSPLKSLDQSEFAKITLGGGGLSIFGSMNVENYEEDTAIAEAIISNLNGNLLADGFDLKQAKYVGFMVVAGKEVWAKLPSQSINYAVSCLGELCNGEIFKGLYVMADMKEEDGIKVFSYFSGLGLPDERLSSLKSEIKELASKAKVKEEGRSLTLKLDTGLTDTATAAEKIKAKIANNKSAFGKLMGNSDRRK